MNDPWDVKSVRQSGQYISCMKINGVPLLPPLLSKECRKEMQYYKLLAKEVEKRISLLKPYVSDSDTESEDKTDAPELPECEQSYELPSEEILTDFNIDIDKVNYPSKRKCLADSIKTPPVATKHIEYSPNEVSTDKMLNSKLVIDLSLNFTDRGRIKIKAPADLPERDRDSPKISDKEILMDVEMNNKNISFKNKDQKSDPFADLSINQDGPSSLSSKSFTGSLNDLHSDSTKNSQITSKLVRQRSYTVLKPSPQLLAHLEIQSLNTGMDMTSISMSESLSNLSSPCKKRRSWDLESAKVKWSSMALELDQNKPKVKPNEVKMHVARTAVKKTLQTSPPRARSLATDKSRYRSLNNKPKSDPIQRTKKSLSPLRNSPSTRTIVKENVCPGNKEIVKGSPPKDPLPISESEDPATRVRELYEKIQKQQLVQMATLVDKQKKEQIMLQQVFEEQNNLLYKQLKSICPKSPIEVKEAWGDESLEADRGPVSLSQLINHKTLQQNETMSPATLIDTDNYINHCDNVLKQSRDITDSLKKQQPKRQVATPKPSPKSQFECTKTATQSSIQRSTPTSRRLKYDSTVSEREYDPVMSDRTNDTMADLNVTFPSDYSDDGAYSDINNSVCNEVTMLKQPTTTVHASPRMEERLRNSINMRIRTKNTFNGHPTQQERVAASTIVAYAKGYLVRRLMRTERVQGIVQTIRDALLCALQLHQEREGIRGADIDLHRRLIQQITAACYSLHDTFVTSTPADRCAMIAADRGRRRSLASRLTPRQQNHSDV